MPPRHGTLLIIGSGPGIGVHVARLFAARGFYRVILASRDDSRLAKEAESVRAAAAAEVEVRTLRLDLADKGSVDAALGALEAEQGLEAVLFNAARVGRSELWAFGEGEVERDLQISVVALYTIGRWALPRLVETAKREPEARPSFLVTSGGLAKEPYPHMFSLAMCKAAQYNFVGSLFKEYSPKGVHLAAIVVQGFVKPDAQVTTPENIAEEAWKLFVQPRGSFDLEVDIVDPEYKERRRKELAAQQAQ